MLLLIQICITGICVQNDFELVLAKCMLMVMSGLLLIQMIYCRADLVSPASVVVFTLVLNLLLLQFSPPNGLYPSAFPLGPEQSTVLAIQPTPVAATTILNHPVVFQRRLRVSTQDATSIDIDVTVFESSCIHIVSGDSMTLHSYGAQSAVFSLVQTVRRDGAIAFILQVHDPENSCLHRVLVLPEDVLALTSTQRWAKNIDATRASKSGSAAPSVQPSEENQKISRFFQTITPFHPSETPPDTQDSH